MDAFLNFKSGGFGRGGGGATRCERGPHLVSGEIIVKEWHRT